MPERSAKTGQPRIWKARESAARKEDLCLGKGEVESWRVAATHGMSVVRGLERSGYVVMKKPMSYGNINYGMNSPVTD
jgi:hypothetical protein